MFTGITPRCIMYNERTIGSYPFSTVYQVIDYYQYNKRGRIKSVNLLEEEHGNSGERIDLRWEMCLIAIERGLDMSTPLQARVFKRRYCEQYPDEWTKGEIIQAIAWEFSRKKSTIYQWLDAVMEDIEREAVDLRLIPPEKCQ